MKRVVAKDNCAYYFKVCWKKIYSVMELLIYDILYSMRCGHSFMIIPKNHFLPKRTSEVNSEIFKIRAKIIKCLLVFRLFNCFSRYVVGFLRFFYLSFYWSFLISEKYLKEFVCTFRKVDFRFYWNWFSFVLGFS